MRTWNLFIGILLIISIGFGCAPKPITATPLKAGDDADPNLHKKIREGIISTHQSVASVSFESGDTYKINGSANGWVGRIQKLWKEKTRLGRITPTQRLFLFRQADQNSNKVISEKEASFLFTRLNEGGELWNDIYVPRFFDGVAYTVEAAAVIPMERSEYIVHEELLKLFGKDGALYDLRARKKRRIEKNETAALFAEADRDGNKHIDPAEAKSMENGVVPWIEQKIQEHISEFDKR